MKKILLFIFFFVFTTFADPNQKIQVTQVTYLRDSIWGSILGKVSLGETFLILERTNQWYKIQWKGQSAWIYANHVKLITETTTPVYSNSQTTTSSKNSFSLREFKQIAAPPEEILAGHLQFPNPKQNGIYSHSAMIPIYFTPATKGLWTCNTSVPVEDGDSFALAFYAPNFKAWNVQITPEGKSTFNPYQNPPSNMKHEETSLSVGETCFPTEVFLFEKPSSENWFVQITTQQTPLHRGSKPEGYLVFTSKNPYRLYTHLAHYQLTQENSIAFVGYIYDLQNTPEFCRETPPTPIPGLIEQAEVHLHYPQGNVQIFPMSDDGAHHDEKSGDGIYGVNFKPLDPGTYLAQIFVYGTTIEGKPFVRTTQHLFPVLAQDLKIIRKATSSLQIDQRIQIDLHIDLKSEKLAICKTFAEVWGTSKDGRSIPIVWIGGITVPEKNDKKTTLPLFLDSRWITRAKAIAPFELRNIRVQNIENHFPIDQMPLISLTLPTIAEITTIPEITDDMLMGPIPENNSGGNNSNPNPNPNPNPIPPDPQQPYNPMATSSSSTSGGKLMLIHGYCSGGVWPTSHFTNYIVFQDFNKSRSHDNFAKLIRDYSPSTSAFGALAHSQGGPATLHLYTYYWSGLDNVTTGSRLIQSTGSPYHGTALAGNLAALGNVFGAGCGTNTDLTYDGSEAWLSGIPTWSRSKVYYWTTAEKDKPWSWDYCQIATDMFLSDPEDGVTEKWSGQLSGANNMGHLEGWCHTANMGDPAQTGDPVKNAERNSTAKR